MASQGERMRSAKGPTVAVVGAGVAGLSCAWLLNRGCDVTLFEAEGRLGGHAHTVEAAGQAVDTGFIVYNEANYPNLSALLDHLGVQTRATDMSFAVSLDDGALEYGSVTPLAMLAQASNILRPRFWSMISDLVRFYREAPRMRAQLDREPMTLGELLDRGGYGRAFQEDHLLPQVGAIWSMSPQAARDYPAEALIRFFDNHGLMKLVDRPLWRTVVGGSACYVSRLAEGLKVKTGQPVKAVERTAAGIAIRDASGAVGLFDQVVIATHADEALRLLSTPTAGERAVLGAFRYSQNQAVLHSDRSLMPRRSRAWSAWNHLGRRDDPNGFCVTYWMNLLQGLPLHNELFVTLNPYKPVDPAKIIGRYDYEHPLFDHLALAAQRQLWSLQGRDRIWFCGAHFGAGFHEDGLQSGLAVAEQLSGVRRPWSVNKESGRIHLGPPPAGAMEAA